MSVKTYALTFVIMVFSMHVCFAQSIQPDSTVNMDAGKQVVDYYNKAIGNRAEVYSGALYQLHPPGIRGSYYFQDVNYLTPATVCYDGTWYKNIMSVYDSYKDIMAGASENNIFIFDEAKLTDIYLLNHHFIYLNATKNLLKSGYYDLIYDGKSQVVVKRSKAVTESISATQAVEFVYTDETDIYVKKDDKYFPVDGKGAVLELFKDKKKDLNQYFKDNKAKYKNDKEGLIVGLTRYYDLINK